VPKPRTPGTEVIASPDNDRRQRRRFTAEQKARILAEADACTERGQLGKLLRREGIYSSTLSGWRAQRQRGGESGLAPQKPGRKPSKTDKDRLIEKLQRENARLERETRIQKGLIDLQRKAHEILGVALPRVEDNIEDDSSSSSNSVRRRSR
jgi:transposase